MRDALTDEEQAALGVGPGDGHGTWSHTELLLAAVIDGVNYLAWQNSQIYGKGRSDPPDPVRRPGVARRNTAGLTGAQITYLNDLRERRRQRHGDPGR